MPGAPVHLLQATNLKRWRRWCLIKRCLATDLLMNSPPPRHCSTSRLRLAGGKERRRIAVLDGQTWSMCPPSSSRWRRRERTKGRTGERGRASERSWMMDGWQKVFSVRPFEEAKSFNLLIFRDEPTTDARTHLFLPLSFASASSSSASVSRSARPSVRPSTFPFSPFRIPRGVKSWSDGRTGRESQFWRERGGELDMKAETNVPWKASSDKNFRVVILWRHWHTERLLGFGTRLSASFLILFPSSLISITPFLHST